MQGGELCRWAGIGGGLHRNFRSPTALGKELSRWFETTAGGAARAKFPPNLPGCCSLSAALDGVSWCRSVSGWLSLFPGGLAGFGRVWPGQRGSGGGSDLALAPNAITRADGVTETRVDRVFLAAHSRLSSHSEEGSSVNRAPADCPCRVDPSACDLADHAAGRLFVSLVSKKLRAKKCPTPEPHEPLQRSVAVAICFSGARE